MPESIAPCHAHVPAAPGSGRWPAIIKPGINTQEGKAVLSLQNQICVTGLRTGLIDKVDTPERVGICRIQLVYEFRGVN